MTEKEKEEVSKKEVEEESQAGAEDEKQEQPKEEQREETKKEQEKGTEDLKEEKKVEETKEKPVEEKERPPMEKNVIFIGEKPFMNYVTSAIMQFTTQNSEDVKIKARGKFISKAVDVAEIVRKRFLKDQVELAGIKTDSEEFTGRDGKDRRVSSIEIILKKG